MKTAKNIQLIVGVSLLVSACFSTVGLVAGKDKPTLCVGNYQSEADAVKQLARFKKTHSNLDEWKARELKIRRQILTGAGLDPLPKKTPLNPVYGKKASPPASRRFRASSSTALSIVRLAGRVPFRRCFARTDITAAPRAPASVPISSIVVRRLPAWARSFFPMT